MIFIQAIFGIIHGLTKFIPVVSIAYVPILEWIENGEN